MKRLREILGPDCELSDAELETLRQDMHELAEIIVEVASVRLSGTAPKIAEPNQSEENIEAD